MLLESLYTHCDIVTKFLSLGHRTCFLLLGFQPAPILGLSWPWLTSLGHSHSCIPSLQCHQSPPGMAAPPCGRVHTCSTGSPTARCTAARARARAPPHAGSTSPDTRELLNIHGVYKMYTSIFVFYNNALDWTSLGSLLAMGVLARVRPQGAWGLRVWRGARGSHVMVCMSY